jgi:hypothetical protein
VCSSSLEKQLTVLTSVSHWPICIGCSSSQLTQYQDHFKNDLRSDQDHLLKNDLRSDQDHFKNDLRSDQDHLLKNDLRSDQDHFKNDLRSRSRSSSKKRS